MCLGTELKFDIKKLEEDDDSIYDYETDPVFDLYAIIGSRDKTSGSALYSRIFPGYRDSMSMEYAPNYGDQLCSTIVYEFLDSTDNTVISVDYLDIKMNEYDGN